MRLWRPVGEMRSVGVWSAADETEINAVLSSLPLHPWMTITVTPLVSHPNDPASHSTPDATTAPTAT